AEILPGQRRVPYQFLGQTRPNRAGGDPVDESVDVFGRHASLGHTRGWSDTAFTRIPTYDPRVVPEPGTGQSRLAVAIHPPFPPFVGGGAVKPVTILFLAANPSGEVRLQTDRERRAIEVEILKSPNRDLFELAYEPGIQPNRLIELFRQHKPQIVHFAG